jgi:hypothetical protein
MLALGLVQRRLRFGRRLLAPFAISVSGGLLALALGLTALLLLLEFGSGLSGVPLADLRRRLLRRLRAMAFLPSSRIPGRTGDRSAPRSVRSIPLADSARHPA